MLAIIENHSLCDLRPKSSFLSLEHDFLKFLTHQRIRGASYQIALFIYQQTIGFNRPSAPLSESWIVKHTRYSKVTVSACLEKLQRLKIIQIDLPKTNPWKTPRIISLNLERFRNVTVAATSDRVKAPSTVQETLTVKEIATVKLFRAQEICTSKRKEEFKKIKLPPFPPEPIPDRGGEISQDQSKAQEIVALFYQHRGIGKQTQALTERDVATVLRWRQESYDWPVIQKAVVSVAKDPETKTIKRAECQLGNAHQQLEKEKIVQAQRTQETQNRADEIEQVQRERDELETLRKSVSPEELKALSQKILEELKAEKKLPEYVWTRETKSRVNQILRERYTNPTLSEEAFNKNKGAAEDQKNESVVVPTLPQTLVLGNDQCFQTPSRQLPTIPTSSSAICVANFPDHSLSTSR